MSWIDGFVDCWGGWNTGTVDGWIFRVALLSATKNDGEGVILEESFFNLAPCLITKKMLPA